MPIRTMMLGLVITLGVSLLSMGQAHALAAGWHGECLSNGDYYATDGNGNYIIYHNSSKCSV